MGNSHSLCRSKKTAPYHSQGTSDLSRYTSRLAPSQIGLLKKQFDEHSQNGTLNFAQFRELLGTKVPEQVAQGVFRMFTQGSVISCRDLCLGYTRYILASQEEQAGFLARIFCPPGKKELNWQHLEALKRFIGNSFKEAKTGDLLDNWIKKKKSVSIREVSTWAHDKLRLRLALEPLELIPLPRTEFDTIKKIRSENSELNLGEQRCVISAQWMKKWQQYVLFKKDPRLASIICEKSRPGKRPIEIDNSGLLQDDFRLRHGLVRSQQFEIISHPEWEILHGWYGGGPPIIREVVIVNGQLEVELYPVVIQVSPHAFNPKTAVSFCVSRTQLVSEVIKQAAEQLKVPASEDLTLSSVSEMGSQLLKSYQTLRNCPEVMTCVLATTLSQDIVLTAAEESLYSAGDQLELLRDGQWVPCIVISVTSSNYILETKSRTEEIANGQANLLRFPPKRRIPNPNQFKENGIVNLGNTCYAAVVIQTLAHTPLLSEFFASGRFAECLTSATQNNLCRPFAALLNQLRSKPRPVDPSLFINLFGRTHSQFKNWQQHDSHEFLHALLGSLHSELIRSPQSTNCYDTWSVENATPEQEEREAQNQWKEIQGKAGSAISDACVGQLRKTLTCPQCKARKVTFEKFMDLSLPLPTVPTLTVRFLSKTATIIYVFIRMDSVDILYSKLGKLTGAKPHQLLAAHVKDKKITQFISQPQTIEELEPPIGHCLYIYQVVASIQDAEANGKPTLRVEPTTNWRDTLRCGQLVDVNHEDTWVVSEVMSVNEKTVRVRLFQKTGIIHEISRASDRLASYRSFTSNADEVLQLPLLMVQESNGDLLRRGDMRILSIGNWNTWQDLDNAVVELCKEYRMDEYTEERPYTWSLRLRSTLVCAWCNFNCGQSHYTGSWETLEQLSAFKDSVCIHIHWNSGTILHEPAIRTRLEASKVSLIDCFRQLTAEETVSLQCGKCDSNKMQSQLHICQVPDILILHLKRFASRDGQLVKTQNYVDFPLKNLDVSEWSLGNRPRDGLTVESTAENFQFNLYSVVNHSGSLERGHYTATCLTKHKKWLEFDDQTVYEFAEAKDVISSRAYILAYQRKRFSSRNILDLGL